MANIYVDPSCANNGDGTDASCASSSGGVGAYNNLADALANATAGDIIWVRRGNSNISVSSTLSPTNDGTESNPIKLVGWPYYEQISGTVDGAISGKEKFGFYDAELTATDKGHYCSAEIEFTSGSNNGLERKVIFYQYDSANSRGEVYVFPDLPNNISAGDQYTITLETELWSDRSQPGQNAGWDNDDYVRPVLDAGGSSIHVLDFGDDLYWHVFNIAGTGNSGNYGIFFKGPIILRNVVGYDCGIVYYNQATTQSYLEVKDLYGWNANSGYGTITVYNNFARKLILENVHIQGESGQTRYGLQDLYYNTELLLKNCSFGKVIELTQDIREYYGRCLTIKGENVELASSTKVYLNISDSYTLYGSYIAISGYNGEPDKFHQWHRCGEIYNVDEDATIDPPSGATTYIKLLPNSHCNSIYPLIYENHRNVSSGSKTYTWKFRPTGWSSLSTSDVEIEVWFLEESSGTKRKYGSANPSSVTNDSWNDLQITFNPGQEGVVYFKITVKKYESGAWVAIDPKPNAS